MKEETIQTKQTSLQEQPNSTKISINAKGLWSGEVKVYGSTSEQAYKTAMILAKELEEQIKVKNHLEVI